MKKSNLCLLVLLAYFPVRGDIFQIKEPVTTKDTIFEPFWFFGLTIFFFLLTLYLIFLLQKMIKNKKVSDRLHKRNEKDQNWNNSNVNKLNNEIKYLQKQNQKLKERKEGSLPVVERKSEPIDLPINKSEIKQHSHFYAGKPTENKMFTDIRNEPDPNSTIFKLSYLENNPEKAEFEVLLVDDFMTKNITNLPDDYLFRVCYHENSNHDFRREIITTKKGVAERIDGKWIVRENNKATIKFQ